MTPVAACAGRSALFDSTTWQDHLKARAVCATCHRVPWCLQQALDVANTHSAGNAMTRGPDGTWAGLLWRSGAIVDQLHRPPIGWIEPRAEVS